MLRKTLYLLLADRGRLERRRRLHRHEGQDLEEVRHHHVAKSTDVVVERRPLVEPERLRHIDLHVIDEVAVPDGLEETVGETEGKDVLRGLLAEEMVDAEDLLLREHFVQLRIEGAGARVVGAERLFHHDPRALDETGLTEHAHDGERRARRHAQVVQTPALRGERRLRALHRSSQCSRAGAQGDVVQPGRE